MVASCGALLGNEESFRLVIACRILVVVGSASTGWVPSSVGGAVVVAVLPEVCAGALDGPITYSVLLPAQLVFIILVIVTDVPFFMTVDLLPVALG